jgi:ATP-dependent protease Clp ATPase subunit
MNNNQKLEWLSTKVFGHNHAKKVLINMFNRIESRYPDLILDGSSAITVPPTLLIGDSGTGKTMLINTIAELYKFPIFHIDATALGPSGSSSKSIDDIKKSIVKFCEQYSKDHIAEFPTERMVEARLIIFIDEFDKLTIRHDSSGNWNIMLQSCLLSIMENYAATFVLAGAFSKDKSLRKDKSKSDSIGFLTNTAGQESDATDLAEKVIEAGLIPELAGRIGNFCLLDKLKKDNYLSILDEMLMPKINRTFEALNKPPIMLTDEFREEICEKAHKGSMGVRYLNQRLSNYVVDHEFDSDNTFDYKKELVENCDWLEVEFIDKPL